MQVEGNNANADDAIMLDKDGYVSETNATNIVRLGSRICYFAAISDFGSIFELGISGTLRPIII